MSFVSAVARSNFIVIATDGRARIDERIVDENAVKIQMINPFLYIAYTGVKEACEEIINESRDFISKTNNLTVIGDFIYKKANSQRYSEIGLSFIIAGKNAQNKYQLSLVNNKKTKKHKIVRSLFEVHTAFSGGDQLETEKFQRDKELFLKRIKAASTPQDIQKAQVWLNNQVASIDDSVNTKVKFYAMPL